MIELSKIIVSGKDNFKFLQGQLTCDMTNITENSHHAALCDNKGRVLVSLQVQKNHENFEIILPTVMCTIFINALRKYAEFSDVSFSAPEIYSPPLDLLSSIRQKIAVILPETSGKFTPHELNYHELGFISFTKGCYKGQEIIARMQYLGKLKKKLTHIISPSSETIEGEVVNSIQTERNYEALVIL